MLNLKKYYPFFKLMDVSFAQFQEGRYEMLDMGYIVMGILRFFIEENNFKEKDVTYPEYLEVSIPTANVIAAADNGSRLEKRVQELFSFQSKASWTKLNSQK